MKRVERWLAVAVVGVLGWAVAGCENPSAAVRGVGGGEGPMYQQGWQGATVEANGYTPGVGPGYGGYGGIVKSEPLPGMAPSSTLSPVDPLGQLQGPAYLPPVREGLNDVQNGMADAAPDAGGVPPVGSVYPDVYTPSYSGSYGLPPQEPMYIPIPEPIYIQPSPQVIVQQEYYPYPVYVYSPPIVIHRDPWPGRGGWGGDGRGGDGRGRGGDGRGGNGRGGAGTPPVTGGIGRPPTVISGPRVNVAGTTSTIPVTGRGAGQAMPMPRPTVTAIPVPVRGAPPAITPSVETPRVAPVVVNPNAQATPGRNSGQGRGNLGTARGSGRPPEVIASPTGVSTPLPRAAPVAPRVATPAPRVVPAAPPVVRAAPPVEAPRPKPVVVAPPVVAAPRPAPVIREAPVVRQAPVVREAPAQRVAPVPVIQPPVQLPAPRQRPPQVIAPPAGGNGRGTGGLDDLNNPVGGRGIGRRGG